MAIKPKSTGAERTKDFMINRRRRMKGSRDALKKLKTTRMEPGGSISS